jgi:hypothetical protein
VAARHVSDVIQITGNTFCAAVDVGGEAAPYLRAVAARDGFSIYKMTTQEILAWALKRGWKAVVVTNSSGSELKNSNDSSPGSSPGT